MNIISIRLKCSELGEQEERCHFPWKSHRNQLREKFEGKYSLNNNPRIKLHEMSLIAETRENCNAMLL